MNCDDVRNGIYVFLDGEFAAPEEGAFQRHVDGCPGCRDLVRREATFLSHVKESLETPRMPDSVRAHVEAALADAPAHYDAGGEGASDSGGFAPWWSRPWLMATPAALAVSVLVFWAWPGDEAAAGDSGVLRQVVAVHTHELPMEVRGSEEQVRAFLQENVPFAVTIPFEDVETMKLVGARLTRVGEQPAVLFRYAMAGRPLTVLQASDAALRAAAAEHAPRVEHVGGYGVVSYGARGVRNTVVGNVPEHDLLRLVPASYAPAP
ncbi:MAG: zf-HC2 domain-containing protein [Myxococcota bacterium]